MGVESIIKPKFWKVTIHSTSAIQQGTLSTGWWDSYFAIDVPDFIDRDNYQVCVESFTCNTSTPSSTTNATTGYIVGLPGFVQGKSYDTVSQSLSPGVLVTSGVSFNRFVDIGSLGYPLRDYSWMRGQNLRVTLSSLDGVLLPMTFFGASAAFGANATKWCMVLAVYPIPS